MCKIKRRLLDINMYNVKINFPTKNANILAVICIYRCPTGCARPAQRRAVPYRAADRRTATGRACLYGLRAWSLVQGTARGPVFVPCQPVKLVVPCWPMAHQTNNNSFSSIFYQMLKYFIIFINYFYYYNNYQHIYTNYNYTNISCSPTGPTIETGCARAACLSGGPSTAWSLGPGRARCPRCRAMLRPGQINGPWTTWPCIFAWQCSMFRFAAWQASILVAGQPKSTAWNTCLLTVLHV